MQMLVAGIVLKHGQMGLELGKGTATAMEHKVPVKVHV
jgi:hypothetical protein